MANQSGIQIINNSVEKIQPGMGALPFEEGVAFRVWAPNADAMSVMGSFNDWSVDRNPLSREGDSEFWYCEVRGAKIGDEYKFLVGKSKTPKIDPYARQVTSTSGNGIVQPWAPELLKKPLSPSDFKMPTWNDLILLEIHIGSFSGKDGKGTFESAIEKLPGLAKVGINAVEIMPVSAFPGEYSEGYNPALPFAVEQNYGGSLGLAKFVSAAHEHGIAVILDVVYNHFGPDDLSGCLWQFDGSNENGYGGIYFYQDWRAETPWGKMNRPDYGRPEVRQYIRDNALQWVEQFQVDGLRFDSVSHIRNVDGNNDDPAHDLPDGWSLLQWINEEIAKRNPWKITIAEDLLHNEWVTRPTGAGGAGFGSQWDIGFSRTIREALEQSADEDRDLVAVANTISTVFDENAFCRVIYTESHDDSGRERHRMAGNIDPEHPTSVFARKRSLLGGTAVLTSPGVPLLLQGQVIFEVDDFDDSTSQDWKRSKKFKGMTLAYEDLIALRKNAAGRTKGLSGQGIQIVVEGPDLIVFHRFDVGGPGDDVIVALNFTNKSFDSARIGFPREGFWKVRFNSDWQGYSPEFGNYFSYDTTASSEPFGEFGFSGNIGIGPYSAVILSQ
jgi:1,4-alpha-glucan branching enzyme